MAEKVAKVLSKRFLIVKTTIVKSLIVSGISGRIGAPAHALAVEAQNAGRAWLRLRLKMVAEIA